MKGGEETASFKEKHIQDTLAKQARENQAAISVYQALSSICTERTCTFNHKDIY